MDIKVSDYDNFTAILNNLECLLPDGIAFIPKNIEIAKGKGDLVYSSEVKTLRKLFLKNGITVEKIENKEEIQLFLHEHSASWLAPTIFIGLSLLSENPNAISIALNVLSNYLTEIFKGQPHTSKFKIDIIVEKEKGRVYKRVTIEGEPTSFEEVAKLIREIK